MSLSHPQNPQNWPSSLAYLLAPSYSPSLPSHPLALSTLRTKPTTSPSIPIIPTKHPLGPSPLVKIKPITNPIHPAIGQHGLFATRDLKPGTLIVIYLGIIHVSKTEGGTGDSDGDSNADLDPHSASKYDLSLDRYTGLGIDAEKKGNEARFINDYRGVPELGGRGANAEFRDVWDERVRGGERGVGVWVLEGGKGKGRRSGIRKGEEVLVSYGRGFWGNRKMDGG